MNRTRSIVAVAVVVAAVVVVGVVVTRQGGGDGMPTETGNDVPVDSGLGFEVTTALEGLDHPWDLAFTPDGSMLITQRTGSIGVLANGEFRELIKPNDVHVLTESGMLGLAVDPEFETNRFFYTCMTSRSSPEVKPDERVVRWAVDEGYTQVTDRRDILSGIMVNTTNGAGHHSGCRLAFGPDGYLWITTGDAATGTNPQDPTMLNGKVLRIDRDGNPAPDNPGGALRPEIYTYGHRNVQGISFRPSDGTPFIIEHGFDCDDEVNVLEVGRNYGWNPVNPADPSVIYYEEVPQTDLEEFPDAVPGVWTSGCPTVAPSGGTFVSGEEWGKWDGALAVATLRGTRMLLLRFDPETNALLGQDATLSDRGRLRTVVQGPDGALFVAVDEGEGFGKILEVRPG